MRLFIGIPLVVAVAAQLEKTCDGLRSVGSDWRWSAPESWHITLQFLGKTNEEQSRCVVAALGRVRTSPVPIKLGTMCFFDRAGVLFADVEVTPELRSLQRKVMAATEPCGFAPEIRAYHPHITLARIKGKDARQGIGNLRSRIDVARSFGRFVADEMLLYESLLGPAGSKYEVRARFPLSG